MVPAYYDIDNDLRSDDDIADLKQVLPHESRNASKLTEACVSTDHPTPIQRSGQLWPGFRSAMCTLLLD